jgi:predicted metal-binding membrane protein
VERSFQNGGRRGPLALAALLLLACCGSWLYSARMALAAPEAMPDCHCHAAGAAPPFLMWVIMMAGMMLPSEASFLLRLQAARQRAGVRRPLFGSLSFLGGYLAVWSAFSCGAAALQALLQEHGLLDQRLASSDGRLSALLLGLAGAAQLLPLKRRCLERCHAPDPLLVTAAPFASAVQGAWQGGRSVLSCGALMLVPFVAGAMDLAVMAALTAFLVAEVLAPRRLRLSEAAGVVLLACAALALRA